MKTRNQQNAQKLQKIASEIEIKHALKEAAERGAKLALETINGTTNNK